MAKLTMAKVQKAQLIPEVFTLFLEDKKVLGVAEKTIKSYEQKFKSCANFYDFNIPIDRFTDEDVKQIVYSMKHGLRLDGKSTTVKDVTIASYMTSLKSFFSWCKLKGFSNVFIPLYHFETEPKEVYTEEEIRKLIKKPNLKKCSFCEYRNWVIVCFLLNCGCRAASLRNVLIKDLDFDNEMVVFRHTKNHKLLYVPIGMEMKRILKEYLSIREGTGEDFLFPNETNQQLTENALRLAIEKYNKSRGVSKTSIHLFRHYFAKTYIQNGGDCFRLQKILGHKKIEMTVHYANLYGTDTKRGFEDFSALAVATSNSQRIKAPSRR